MQKAYTPGGSTYNGAHGTDMMLSRSSTIFSTVAVSPYRFPFRPITDVATGRRSSSRDRPAALGGDPSTRLDHAGSPRSRGKSQVAPPQYQCSAAMSAPAAAAVHTSHSPAAKVPMLCTSKWAFFLWTSTCMEAARSALLPMPMFQHTNVFD